MQQITAHPYQVDKNYFIRTFTNYYTGKLVEVTENELVLEDCAWIADTGRFGEAMKSGSLNEVEPFPAGQVIIARSGVVDAHIFNHNLPREEK